MDLDVKQMALALKAIAEEKNLPEDTVQEVVEHIDDHHRSASGIEAHCAPDPMLRELSHAAQARATTRSRGVPSAREPPILTTSTDLRRLPRKRPPP